MYFITPNGDTAAYANITHTKLKIPGAYTTWSDVITTWTNDPGTKAWTFNDSKTLQYVFYIAAIIHKKFWLQKLYKLFSTRKFVWLFYEQHILWYLFCDNILILNKDCKQSREKSIGFIRPVKTERTWAVIAICMRMCVYSSFVS